MQLLNGGDRVIKFVVQSLRGEICTITKVTCALQNQIPRERNHQTIRGRNVKHNGAARRGFKWDNAVSGRNRYTVHDDLQIR